MRVIDWSEMIEGHEGRGSPSWFFNVEDHVGSRRGVVVVGHRLVRFGFGMCRGH